MDIPIRRSRLCGDPELELLEAEPLGRARAAILFVHGAYTGAWCWEDFLRRFAARGFRALAVSLRGHGQSAGAERLHGWGLRDYGIDLGRAVAASGGEPVLIGHSMGAFLVQRYLAEGGVARAAVQLCPVPLFGIGPASVALAVSRPLLYAEMRALAEGRSRSRAALAELLFGGAVPRETVETCFHRMQPESRRALAELALPLPPMAWHARRVPQLVLAAEKDLLIPALQAASAAALVGAEYRELPGLGHAAMLAPRRDQVMEAIVDWLAQRGL